jgi:hypothetical protein
MTTIIKSALVVGAGVLGVTLGLIISLSPPRVPAPVPPPFRFIGTPSVSGGLLTFQITNEGRRLIHYLATPPQVRSNGQWIDFQPPSGRGTFVVANQTSMFTAVAPSNGLPWRVPVYWSYAPTKMQFWKVRVENMLRRQNRGLGIETHVVYSPEIMP